jgi:hypothetical protein
MTAALLGAGAASADIGGKVESSLLLYSETDRVKAAEALTGVKFKLKGDRLLSVKLTYDALSGASPNGAAPADRIQTFTRPSGGGQYTTPANETPLDDTFHDTRFGIDASIAQPLDRLTTLTVGGHVSAEYDYQSYGIHAGISRDFNKRNTTLDVSGAFSSDKITPEGGIPEPFAEMPTSVRSLPRIGGSDSKTTIDAVVGVTQVIDRKTLAQVNYSFSSMTGYLTDPFKILSVVEAPESENAGNPISYIYENRPDSRTKHALFGRVRRYLAGNQLDAAFRYYWDDWSVRSYTIDLFYRQSLWGTHAIQPHFRWYRQSAADIYRSFLIDGAPTPSYASADYRLAKFDAYTVGLQYFFPVMDRANFSIAGEYYSQLGDRSPPEAFGSLKSVDLFPDLDVIMIRLGLSYDF